MKSTLRVVAVTLFLSFSVFAQSPEPKFIADTLVVQADGTYETDPDLATMEFQIFSQEKELRKAYDAAALSMQRIVDLAEKNNLKKEDVVTGVLTVSPFYQGDRKKNARSYSVQGEIKLRIHDFSKIGPILEGTIDDGVTDFRSITYSLEDEETAKKQAVAVAMRRAIGRASIALEQKGQKLGGLRYMSLDVKQLYGVATIQESNFGADAAELITTMPGFAVSKSKSAQPPPPPSQPEKITVTANVQCAFQID
jgi:uncharacterized protein YggE